MKAAVTELFRDFIMGGVWENNKISNARIAHAGAGNRAWWWLRSPGYDRLDAACVHNDGDLIIGGSGVTRGGGGVRPALWLNLES